MRILHLTSETGWRGGEKQLALLVKNLPRSFDNHVCAPAGSEAANRLSDQTAVHTCASAGFLDWRSALTVRSLIRRHRIDMLHAHTSKAQETALLARLGLATPLAVSRRVSFQISGGWKYDRVDRFFAVSRAAEAELVKGSVRPERIEIIHDGVDGGSLDAALPDRAGIPDDATMVLCAAAFTQEKDHRTLLSAWKEVERTNSTAWLSMAGDGPLLAEMKVLSASLLLSRVNFLGWREDVASLVCAADVVALSSCSEGLGSVLCEAQWLGKPVAATKAGGIPEAVPDGETGLLSPVADAPALAANLIRLCSDRTLREEFGRKGRLNARRQFDPKIYAAHHASAYLTLAGAPA